MKKPAIIASARTPIGSFLGSLKTLSAPLLAKWAIEAVLLRAKINPEDIDEVILGQVLQGGSGQAPARQAALAAGLLSKTPCTTVNKVCGSGLKAIMMASDQIALGQNKAIIAGGMESMSNAPYILPNARDGLRSGHQKILDLMIHDGLFDPYGQSAMGGFGDICAKEFLITRDMQDEYAKKSYEKALSAQKNGYFAEEIVPVKIRHKQGEDIIKHDEEPRNYKPEKMGFLKPAFNIDGSVTAANASKISDGAAALLIMEEEEAKNRGMSSKARIMSHATFAQGPEWFTTAPIKAIKEVSRKAGIAPQDIDLFEINEAFSVVPMVAMRELGLNAHKINVFGGAVALGHPIGSSGARILVTLVNAMHVHKVRFGCAAICLGGGEAVAMIIERTEN